MRWQGKRVVVTGACGFIGSHLVERLVREGAQVRAFVHYNAQNHWGWLESVTREVRREIEVIPGDVRDRMSVTQAMRDQEIVFHLAALIAIPYSYAAPASYIETNILGTLNVLQAARELGLERVIHTSTSEVYGTARQVPIPESHPLQGQSPYSASKIGADKLAESYFCSFGLPVVVVRPFNTFGPRQSARAIIPTIISQSLNANGSVALGDLKPVRDFTFVSDTVEGLLQAAARDAAGQVINLGAGSGVSVGELAQTIFSLMGISPKIRLDRRRLRPRESEVLKLVSDNRKARRLLLWRPQVSMEKGLERTIEWMRRNPHHYKPELYHV